MRSSAATKCISEVPGLEKHVVTPLFNSDCTRLSAPFIARGLLMYAPRLTGLREVGQGEWTGEEAALQPRGGPAGTQATLRFARMPHDACMNGLSDAA